MPSAATAPSAAARQPQAARSHARPPDINRPHLARWTRAKPEPQGLNSHTSPNGGHSNILQASTQAAGLGSRGSMPAAGQTAHLKGSRDTYNIRQGPGYGRPQNRTAGGRGAEILGLLIYTYETIRKVCRMFCISGGKHARKKRGGGMPCGLSRAMSPRDARVRSVGRTGRGLGRKSAMKHALESPRAHGASWPLRAASFRAG